MPPATPETASLDKLTGSRPWLHRVKTPRWKPKTVTLTPEAIISYADDKPYHKPKPTTVLVLPGGARPGTPDEQLRLRAAHLLVITAVHTSDEGDPAAKTRLIFFSAPSRELQHRWLRAANHASFSRLGLHDEPRLHPFLAAWGHTSRLPVRAAAARARALNHSVSDAQFAAAWEALRKRTDAAVHARQFVDVMMRFAVNAPVRRIVDMATDGRGGELTPPELAKVMLWTEERAKTELTRHGVDRCAPALLVQLLFDPDNTVVEQSRVRELHDMTLPLNKYLISSSHNTYLTGDQLRSDSTAEMYRIVLERGCRCVEIDAWDGDDGEPIVRHGHTITSTETFENVIRAVKEHSFSHGFEYPVILSIENHMERPQQEIAALIIRDILGDMLYAPSAEEGRPEELPSPEDLKGRIVIKAKTGMSIMRPEYLAASNGGSSLDDIGDGDDDSDDPRASADAAKASSPGKFSLKSGARTAKRKIPPPAESPIAKEFGELAFLAGGSRKALVPLWKEGQSGSDRYIAASCVSINEKKLADVYESDCVEAIRQYNSHGLTRVYPKGSRVDSSNYVPTLAHFLGCQIVALNWQKQEAGLAVNQARFLANGGCGYVLASSVVAPAEPATLKIQLLSAFLIPKSKSTVRRDVTDPYVIIKAYDQDFSDEDDYCSFKFTSQVARSNGFAPSWEETVSIPITNRALAVICVKLFDADRTSTDDFIGYLSVPTSLMRNGIRSFPLNSKDGSPLTLPGTDQQPSLLCIVSWE